ncbi:MAG: AAA family ATPase [Bacteroidetes bacterium GWF2_40_14]|nr:MAG: AAA family ATPase [Bacteroidetes bacterium GWF2_40_14]
MVTNKYQRVIADQQIEVFEFDLQKFCTRTEEALFDLESPLAQIVIGVRRCGKSTLCHKVLLQNKIGYAYVNFDDERLASLKTEQLDDVLEAIYIVYGDFKYLFLDEIQNVKEWSLFVNRLLRQNLHLIITGSNAKLLSSELSTYLTGRYNQIELFPFSFSEYLELRGIKSNVQTTKDIAFRKQAFEDFLTKGGFPELFNVKDSKGYVKRLVNNIIAVDIKKRFKIRYIDTLIKITNYLIANFAQEINYKGLADNFSLGSQHTALNYVNYLRQTYILVGINKFSFKARERIRSEKMYLIDQSLVTEQDNNLTTENIGWRLENIVFLELLRRKKSDDYDVYYYRNGYEIDFVVCKKHQPLELIQVSMRIDTDKTFKRETSSLVKGSKAMKCTKLTLLTLGENEIHNINGAIINEVNIIDWLLQNLR